MSRDFIGALLQLNAEKQVPREQLVRTVEDAIQSAYRRVDGSEDIQVRIDPETGKIRVFRARYVVDEIEDELTQITVDDARAHDQNAKVGGESLWSLNIKYWEKRFQSGRMMKLRLYGATGMLFNSLQ